MDSRKYNNITHTVQGKVNINNDTKKLRTAFRLRRSKSLDEVEIKDIIEFDDVRSLIRKQSLRDSEKVIEEPFVENRLDRYVEESVSGVVIEDGMDDDYFSEVDSFFGDSINSIDSYTLNDSDCEELSSIRRSLSFSAVLDLIRNSTEEDEPQRSLHVKFGDVEERIYSLILGDHPDCKYGPPTQLSWNYQENDKLDISTYESQKPFKRNMRQLGMSWAVRENLLLQKGYTKKELKVAMKSVRKSKGGRNMTNIFSMIQVTAYDARSAIGNVAKTMKPIVKKGDRKDCLL